MTSPLISTSLSSVEERTSPIFSSIPTVPKNFTTEEALTLLLTPNSALSEDAVEQPSFKTPDSTISGSKTTKNDVYEEGR